MFLKGSISVGKTEFDFGVVQYLSIYFISIFILLTRRKATEALIHMVSNYPDLLPKISKYYFSLKI